MEKAILWAVARRSAAMLAAHENSKVAEQAAQLLAELQSDADLDIVAISWRIYSLRKEAKSENSQGTKNSAT